MAGYYITRHVVQPGVGLAAEIIGHRKSKKSRDFVEETLSVTATTPIPQESRVPKLEQFSNEKTTQIGRDEANTPTLPYSEDAPPPYQEAQDLNNFREDDDIAEASGEEDWELDEAAANFDQMDTTRSKFTVPRGNAFGPASIGQIVEAFVNMYPPVQTGGKLGDPVILRQKRPGNQTRGFVHGYAPSLKEVGISQPAWMDFLACFEESIKITAAFDVINMAVGVAGIVGHFVPNPVTTAATIAVTVAEETARATYQRIRTNSFFAEMNERFFMPLGLYCLIMTYNPYAHAASQPFDLSSTLSKAYDPKRPAIRAYLKKNLGGIGGHSSETQMPKPAELVFPEIDNSQRENKGNRFTRGRRFVDEYMDKRALSRFAANNPGSVLADEPEFESKHGNFGTRHLHTGRGGPIGAPLSRVVEKVSKGKYKGREANPIVMATRAARPKVLFLMVATMPSAEEMHAVRECFDIKDMDTAEVETGLRNRWQRGGSGVHVLK